MIEDVDATQTDRAPRVVRRGTPGSTLVLEVALRNAGMRAGGKGCACLISWAIAVHRTGDELGAGVEGHGHVTAAVRDFAEYWSISERTAWRDLDAFRACFPTEETPARMAAEARALYDGRVDELEAKQSTAGFHLAIAA